MASMETSDRTRLERLGLPSALIDEIDAAVANASTLRIDELPSRADEKRDLEAIAEQSAILLAQLNALRRHTADLLDAGLFTRGRCSFADAMRMVRGLADAPAVALEGRRPMNNLTRVTEAKRSLASEIADAFARHGQPIDQRPQGPFVVALGAALQTASIEHAPASVVSLAAFIIARRQPRRAILDS